ncbi:MAG: hypothetical protein GC192_21425 [Bacteroidetes bacterium]|nr:hypothetical protein [Bacteroidota bacterium]
MEQSNLEVEKRKHRLAEAINLQKIEGNPLTLEEIAMFEMFEHEGWSDEKCREYILGQFRGKSDDKNLAAE